MSRLSKEETARFSGAEWALRLCEEKGIEGCRKELEGRGLLGMPLRAKKSDVKEYVMYTKDTTLATVLMMACMVLHDEFDFGTVRLNRFIDRFQLKAECLTDDYVDWPDIQKTLEEETGIRLPLPDEFRRRIK